jgi:photosystem II stability/assembly factor-like uncharacterized protein
MKKAFALLLLIGIAACSAVPASSPAAPAPSLTAAPFATPADPTLTPAPPGMPEPASTLIIPTLRMESPVNLVSVQMFDSRTGWGIHREDSEVLRPEFRTNYPWPTEGYILRTTDGGETWQNVTPPSGAYSPGGFFALDADTAWASENLHGSPMPMATRVWRTTDGGQTWQSSQPFWIADWSEIYFPTAIRFIDQNTGWLLAATEVGMNGYSLRETLFRTRDGGNTWERINSFLEDLGGCGNGALAFRDAKTGWYGMSCVGGGKLIMSFSTIFAQGGLQVRHTLDAGETFSADTLIPTPPELQELAAANPEMMDCGESRMIAFTPEVVGIEWECINYTDRMRYKYFSLSTDAGRTWNTWESAGNEYFLDATHGWRSFPSGAFQQTIDGGQNWITLKSVVAWETAQFDFISEQEGWASVTSGGLIALIHTTDGGQTWKELSSVIAYP